MYQVYQPKICFGKTGTYDKRNNTFQVKIMEVFDTEQELITFLAKAHSAECNALWNITPGKYANKYMQNQALTGAERSSEYEIDRYSFDAWLFGRGKVVHAHAFKDGWRIPDYLFWLYAPGLPNVDVRKYEKEVEKKYLELQANENCSFREWLTKYQNRKKRIQGRASHHSCRWRSDCHCIQRAKQNAWLQSDEKEYRKLAKPKDRQFKSIWPDEDCVHGRRSSGWKDNPGNKQKKQWMAKAAREYEKIRRHRDIAMYSAKKGKKKKKKKNNTIFQHTIYEKTFTH